MNHIWFKNVTFAVELVKQTAKMAAKQIPRKLRTLAKIVFAAIVAKKVKVKKVKLTFL